MEVYVDVVMLLNFGVDLMLLLGTNRLSGRPPGVKKSVSAAVFGGLYAGLCVIPGFSFLGNTLWRIVSLILMSGMAFGWNIDGVRRGVLFVFLSMALGGIVLMLGRGGIWSVILAVAILGWLCLLGFERNKGKREYASVYIRKDDRTVHITALIDTGNTLKDPVSGQPVLVADSRAAMELLQLSESELRNPIDTVSRGIYHGLRLIPYCAVGQQGGLLLGLRVDELRINGNKVDQIVAFAPNRIGQGNGYEALTGGIA